MLLTTYILCALACKEKKCDIVFMVKKAPEKKTEFLSVRVPTATKTALADIAAEKERSLSWVVAKILEEYLRSGKKGKL